MTDFFEMAALIAGMTPEQAKRIAAGSYTAAERINAEPRQPEPCNDNRELGETTP